MKKQIVITLTKEYPGWLAEICGIVDKSKNETVDILKTGTMFGLFDTKQLAISCITCQSNLETIEKWMEQIG